MLFYIWYVTVSAACTMSRKESLFVKTKLSSLATETFILITAFCSLQHFDIQYLYGLFTAKLDELNIFPFSEVWEKYINKQITVLNAHNFPSMASWGTLLKCSYSYQNSNSKIKRINFFAM